MEHGFCTTLYDHLRDSLPSSHVDLLQVTFPNGVFSGTIISSVVKNGSILKTAEWQLLLGSIALPGVLVGAWLCDRLGRKNTMMLGFSGYRTYLSESQAFADDLQWSLD